MRAGFALISAIAMTITQQPQVARASCVETGVWNYATDPAQGPLPTYAYPVNGYEGQLNTTWLHHFSTGCVPPDGPNSHETVGITFLWSSGNDWIEIGDEKWPNYGTSTYGRLWEEWHIYPNNPVIELAGGDIPQTSPFVGMLVQFVGTPTVKKWRMYYDLSGTYTNWQTADTIYGFPSDRGGGRSECSRWGTGSDCNSSQAYINYRLPADGLFRARSTHTWCVDTDSSVDALPAADFPNVRFGPQVDGSCNP